MKILVIKLTSMGDILHLLPALTDLQQHNPDITVDWVVEENFTEIPTWHPLVNEVIPVATRRWRRSQKGWFSQVRGFIRKLRSQQYDLVIDAQGLIKSAFIARFAKGKRVGFCKKSIKESPAALLYQQSYSIDKNQHAIDRLRQLFAQTFKYDLPTKQPNYGLTTQTSSPKPSIFLFHGTTWKSKHLPQQLWRQIAQLASNAGYQVKLAWGSEAEKQAAKDIAQSIPQAQVLPKMSLTELAEQLRCAAGAIAVDTGLGHMAAALNVPCVSIYGATDAALTGTIGRKQIHIQTDYPCSPCLLKNCKKLSDSSENEPCYLSLDPDNIWYALFENSKSLSDRH